MRRTREYDASARDRTTRSRSIDTVLEDNDGNLEIPSLDMLLATVAVARVLTPVQLVGAELRFLRHVLHMTGSEFARAIDLSDKTIVSRWENGKSRPGGFTEKIIRQLIPECAGSPRARYRDIGKRDPRHEDPAARSLGGSTADGVQLQGPFRIGWPALRLLRRGGMMTAKEPAAAEFTAINRRERGLLVPCVSDPCARCGKSPQAAGEARPPAGPRGC